VFADWLLERGDPRGEYMALQFREAEDATSDRDVKRARALLREHRHAWLGGPLAATLRDVRFERGFLAVAELAQNAAASEETWREAASHPALATMRELRQGRGNARHYHSFVTSSAARSLRRIDYPQPAFLRRLIEGDAIYPFTRLRLDRVPSRTLWRRLATASSLAKVVGVAVPLAGARSPGADPAAAARAMDAILADLAAVGFLGKLRAVHLGPKFHPGFPAFAGTVVDLARELLDRAARVSPPLPCFSFNASGCEVEMTQTADGGLVRLRGQLVSMGSLPSGAASIVQVLPNHVRQLRVDAGHLGPARREELANAARDRGILLRID
jgi:hypothetical protein